MAQKCARKELNLDYDGKRDRWNGFQPDDYKQVIEERRTGYLWNLSPCSNGLLGVAT